jgi:hypothetical protein
MLPNLSMGQPVLRSRGTVDRWAQREPGKDVKTLSTTAAWPFSARATIMAAKASLNAGRLIRAALGATVRIPTAGLFAGNLVWTQQAVSSQEGRRHEHQHAGFEEPSPCHFIERCCTRPSRIASYIRRPLS